MTEIICPECGGTEFKKEYKSEHNVETYCKRCGLILKKDDLADEYNNTGWSERGFRPNSYDICYTNHILDYYDEIEIGYNSNVVPSDTYSENDDLPGGYSRTPDDIKETWNIARGALSDKNGYKKWLLLNNFEDNLVSQIKYCRRYFPEDYLQLLKDNNNYSITKKPVSNQKFIEESSELYGKDVYGLYFWRVKAKENKMHKRNAIPSINKVKYKSGEYKDNVKTMKNNPKILDDNLNELWKGMRLSMSDKRLKEKKLHDKIHSKGKGTENNIGGTLMSERMDDTQYFEKLYPKKVGIKRKCLKCGEIFITTENRQCQCENCFPRG
jgi:transcription initiation factor TFIIIB Brf1 subunit/transcription initiation factor TFIIB